MRYKTGEKVRVISQEKQVRMLENGSGNPIWPPPGYRHIMTLDMRSMAGKETIIDEVRISDYFLEVDGHRYSWEDWMLDPVDEGRELSAEDAIRAMLDGEELYDERGNVYWYDRKGCCFYCLEGGTPKKFSGLFRKPKGGAE
jgi:hypothetical protein